MESVTVLHTVDKFTYFSAARLHIIVLMTKMWSMILELRLRFCLAAQKFCAQI